MNLRNVTIGLSAGILLGMMGFVAYIASFGGAVNMLLGVLFFLPFCGFPPIVSMVIAGYSKHHVSQILAVVASLLYGVWFTYAMYDCFYVHVDPQSALIIIFVGIYALPVLLPLWITAHIFEIRHRKKQAEP